MLDHNIYRFAASLLRKQGWRQNGLGSENGSKCVAGAIYYSLPRCTAMIQDEYYGALANYLELPNLEGTIVPMWRVALWNDADDRTQEEVISALESFAESLEASSVIKEKELVNV